MVCRKKEAEDLLPSITKNCKKLFKQTHRSLQGTLEFKLTKQENLFQLHHLISWS